MKVKITYGTRYNGESRVTIQIIRDTVEDYGVAFVTGNGSSRVISFSDIINPEKLEGLDVDFNLRYNEEYFTNQIIPVGLLTMYEWYESQSSLVITNISIEDYYKIDLVVEGILEAIKIKHKGVLAYCKIKDRVEEEIDFEKYTSKC